MRHPPVALSVCYFCAGRLGPGCWRGGGAGARRRATFTADRRQGRRHQQGRQGGRRTGCCGVQGCNKGIDNTATRQCVRLLQRSQTIAYWVTTSAKEMVVMYDASLHHSRDQPRSTRISHDSHKSPRWPQQGACCALKHGHARCVCACLFV